MNEDLLSILIREGRAYLLQIRKKKACFLIAISCNNLFTNKLE